MHRMLVVLGMAALAAAPTAASAQTADVMLPIHQFVDAFNKGDTKAAVAACVDATSIIDEFPPHEWHGAGVCAKWMNDYDADAKKNGITAVIASDQAVIQYAVSVGMPVHMSTQTNISNLAAVKYYSQFADVMVTARELELAQVSAITRAIKREKITGPSGKLLRIEIFAHGALCMAISGKCYLSLDNYNAPANRGACYQLCRRPYKVTDLDGEVELVVDNEYIMSPKDLCTIGFLDKILAAGVSILKIEGRGRSPEYVKTVISCYREAVDSVEDGTYSTDKVAGWMSRLKTVYNRGFWDGYYLGQTLGDWAGQHGSQATQRKEYVGKVTNYFRKLMVAEIQMESGFLKPGDAIYIQGPTTGSIDLIIPEIRVDLKPVKKTAKGDQCSILVDTFLRRADKVYKIINNL